MAFTGWKRFFGRSGQQGPEEPLIGEEIYRAEPRPPQPERGATAGAAVGPGVGPVVTPSDAHQYAPAEVEHGLRSALRLAERIDEHLAEHNRLLAHVAEGQSAFPSLIEELARAADAGRQLHESSIAIARERDGVAKAMLSQMQDMAETLRLLRQNHQDEINLVTRLHRSGRRLLFFLLVGALGLALVLLLLLLVVVLRPDAIRNLELPRSGATAPTSVVPPAKSTPESNNDPALDDAQRSSDSAIRDFLRSSSATAP
jgi:hypothetical protein